MDKIQTAEDWKQNCKWIHCMTVSSHSAVLQLTQSACRGYVLGYLTTLFQLRVHGKMIMIGEVIYSDFKGCYGLF